MTLIITAATESNMVQVCDRRLTTPDGGVFDSSAHKIISVACRDARFSIAYTGLAVTGARYADRPLNLGYRRPKGYSQSPWETTDEWLVDCLALMDTNHMGFADICDALEQNAATAFSSIPLGRQYRGLTFVLCGYWAGEQFITIISNMEDAKGKLVPISDDFQSWTWRKRQPFHDKNAFMLFHGLRAAIHDTIGRRVNKIRGRLYSLPGPEVVKELEGLVRATTRHPALGQLIGSECSHAIISPRPGIIMGDNPVLPSQGHSMPSFILRGMAFKGISLQPIDDDGEDPESTT